MRFLVSSLVGILATASLVSADLRKASSPQNKFQVQSRGNKVAFVPTVALYMEPSDFKYAGLKDQRDNGAYDNFLRSNIDNEQDKRNFRTEDGQDHLPFRSFNGAADDSSTTVKNKIAAVTTPKVTAVTVNTAVQNIEPLRWNNPHASELEVNIWIMPGAQTAKDANGVNQPVVVPIRKPTCSGEGYQDNVFTYTVPAAFNDLGSKIPGFAGCKKVGDCVLQVYAHSVETRQYASGVPLIINGNVAAATATGAAGAVAMPDIEVGTAITGNAETPSLKRDTCLPSNDPSADIAGADLKPRFARLISDQFNHAYQNSDYSPYSGQQPLDISKNLQAAAVARMTIGNRGELGRSVLAQNATKQRVQQNLQGKWEQLYQKYESITNAIIAKIANLPAATKMSSGPDQMGENNVQKTETCFRCAEVGATNTNRLTTTTYIPSFVLQNQEQLTAAIGQLPGGLNGKYGNLLSTNSATFDANAKPVVQIYMAALMDLSAEMNKAAALDIKYLPAVIKPTLATMSDATGFKKKTANGGNDNGQYATLTALKQMAAADAAAAKRLVLSGTSQSAMAAYLNADIANVVLPSLNSDQPAVANQKDMDAMNYDEICELDETWDQPCGTARRMFEVDADGNTVLASTNGASSLSSSSSVIALFAAAAAAIVHFRA